jgi:prephenate dehydrogenase
MKCAIIGLGLIGGSLGLSLKKSKIFEKIAGYDKNSTHQKEALRLKLVDEIVEFEQIKEYDVIFLAIPVEGIVETLQKLPPLPSDITIIDTGSTKEEIIKKTPKNIRKNLIAAHPMAGTEKFGPKAAIENLYKDKIVVFCNIEESGEIQKNIAIKIFNALKMQIVYMDAKEHDKHAAFISHLPHAISFALANSVLKQEDPKSILILAAGGFKDMSRLAKSSPLMWKDIFKQNKDNIILSLDAFKKELKTVKELIIEENWEELKKWMEKATNLHKIL